MFNTIFTGTLTDITLMQFLITSAAAFVCGLIIAAAYSRCVDTNKNFLLTIVLIPFIVCGTIMMVNGNIGTGIAVAGSFSLVRFRSLPGKASDIAAVFLAMASGLACANGLVGFALCFAVIPVLVGFLLAKAPVLEAADNTRSVKVCVAEDFDFTKEFDEVFGKYCSSHKSRAVKSMNLGTMYEVTYDVILKKDASEKEMLDELRIKNGNLNVISVHGTTVQENL